MIDRQILDQHGVTEGEYARILELLGREPNLLELGLFSVMWSEHCSYKSSRAPQDPADHRPARRAGAR